MKKICSIILTFLMAFGLVGCMDMLGGSSSKYEIVGKTTMRIDHESYLGYSVEITGKLKNTSKKEFTYVSVTFAIYDAEGSQIETAMDNMNYLQAGETWSFTAIMFSWTDERPVSYKLVEVEAW